MPTVPRYEQQTVGLNPVAIPHATALGAEAYGAGLGQGLEKAGNSLLNAAAIENRWAQVEKAKQDKAILDGAEAKTIEHYNDLLLAASAVKGIGVQKDYAADGKPKQGEPNIVDRWETEFKTRLAEITKDMTPEQQDQYKLTAEKYRIALKKNTMGHFIGEIDKWQEEQFTAKLNLQQLTWAKAPEGTEKVAEAQVMATLAEKWSGKKLEEEQFNRTQVVNYQRATDAILRDPTKAPSVIEKYKGSLTEEHTSKLADLGRQRVNVIVGEKYDVLFKESILPALTDKTYIKPLAGNVTYAGIASLDPKKAGAITTDAAQYNSGLAMDKFNDYMSNVSTAKRAVLTFDQVDADIRKDLKTYNTSAYNRLEAQFNSERILRQEQADAKKAAKNDASALMIQALLNPESVDQTNLVSLIQSGQMDAKLGMDILKKVQEGGNVRGALEAKGQVAQSIDSEADALVQGVKEGPLRVAAKKKVLGTIYNVLTPLFGSTVEVTPDAVKAALVKMRTATVEEAGWTSNSKTSIYNVNDKTDVAIPAKYRQQAEMLAIQYQTTPGKAWAIWNGMNAAGKDPRRLLIHKGGR